MTRLIKLSIKNYRPFCNKEVFSFSPDTKKPWTVMYAGTGSGKTTLLDTIAWCLYGKEIHKPQPIDTMLNDKKKNELKERGTADVQVEIIMGENEKKIDYVFSRSLSFIKDKNNKVRALPYTEKAMVKIKDARNNLIDAPNPKVPVQWLFPEDIQHLFMFDGEKLQHFFEGHNAENTEKAIVDITQIEFLGKAIDHLKDVSRFYRQEDEGSNPIIEELSALINGANQKIEEEKTEEAECNRNLSTTKKKLEIVLDRLKGIDSKDLKKLLEDEEEISDQLKRVKESLMDLEKESFEHLLGSVPLLFCKKQLEKAIKLINKKYDSGELPPNIKIPFLDKLLNEKEECICGTSLKEGTSARKKVEEFREKVPLSKYEDQIRDGQSQIRILLSKISNFSNERKKYYKQIEEKQNDELTLNKRLSAIKDDIKGLNKEEIESLYSQKEFLLGEIQRYSTRIGEIKNGMEICSKEIKGWDNRRRKEEEIRITNKEMREKYKICNTSINFLEEIKDTLKSEVKEAIEERTNELFKRGVNEPRVEKVCITKDFECQVLDHDGENILDSLSSGQKEILATSFMIALRQESGFDSPILIDYPFGRIDGPKRIELLEQLKEILKGVQVTFFLITETEFTDSVRNKMKDQTGKLIEIKKVKNELRSEVIQHERI